MKLHHLHLAIAPVVLVFAAPLRADVSVNWPQASSDMPADSAVKFGVLPNGLRYAILHNETPSTGVSLRMLINAGSMTERDDEQGLMHFLEHMSFRSSDKIADGDVVRMLQRHGLRFGADTNAFTFFDQIVYKYDFPNNDAESIADGMLIFREVASKLKLDPALVEAEKGVVLSEERARDTAGFRGLKVQYALAGEGTRAIERYPIGKVETLKAATSARLRRLYEANFRPENAVLFVVGNVDVAAIEKDIRARFADWKPAGTPDKIDLGKPSPSRTAAEFTGEGAPDYLVVNWPAQADLRPDTMALEKEKLLRQVGITVLNNRLGDRAAKPGSPYVTAGLNADDKFASVASLTSLQIISAPENWRAALDAALTEQRQLMQDGMTPAELARAVSILKTQLKAEADGASTRTSAQVADEITGVTQRGEVFTSPVAILPLANAVLDSATPAQVMAALQTAFDGRKPVLFRSAKAGPVGEAALAEALNTTLTKPLEKRVAEAAFTWPYGDWGKPGSVVSRAEDKALGTTTVRFANGTSLIVKPTAFAKDSVRVSVSLGGGRAAVPPALAHTLWAGDQMVYGGTGKASLVQIQQWAETSGKVITVAPQLSSVAASLMGVTRPADLDAQMQLLTAYARDPGFRAEEEDKVKATAPMFANQLSGNAQGSFVRGRSQVLTGGDARYTDLPSEAELSATRPGDLKALWSSQLAAKADITIVGDVTPDKAIAAVAASFGAGPAVKPAVRVRAAITMPKGREAPYVFEHGGRKDQAFYGLYWQMPDYFASPKEAVAADLLSKVLGQRLVDSVREKLGITYSPTSEAIASRQISGYGYLGALIETPEANFATFRKIVLDQMADLAAKPVSDDELLRARKQVLAMRKQERERNEFWLSSLALSHRVPAMRTAILDAIPMTEAVTAADIQALAKKRLAAKVPVTVLAKAKGS